MRFIDLTGKRFGKLVVLSEEGKRRGLVTWKCICDCGNEHISVGADLRNGNTKSCGCMSSRKFAGERTRTHGLSNTKIYAVWRTMKCRCVLPSQKSYKDYGGRGITVCDEWKESFISFYDWAMLNGYEESLTIDRIDSNGNYEPSNCKWSTRKEQNNNKRNTKVYTVNGFTGNKTELMKHFNVAETTFRRKLNSGMNISEALIKSIRR